MSQPEAAMLTSAQIDFYREEGYLRIPAVFTPEETAALRRDLDWMIEAWATKSVGWTGPWRQQYMDADTESKSMLIAMHDLHFYAESWMRAVTNAKLVACMGQLLGNCVELHHSTMHVKPPETGHPFPMHQDWAFYQHADDRYVDTLVHLDETRHENGEIRFLPKSHKLGPLEHITRWEGEPCTPHLPWEKYRLEDTVAVPARAGDVVIFNIHTIHGSHINVTDEMRRLVRIGYKHPENRQVGGQSRGRPSLMVLGRRERTPGSKPFTTGEVHDAPAMREPALAGAK